MFRFGRDGRSGTRDAPLESPSSELSLLWYAFQRRAVAALPHGHARNAAVSNDLASLAAAAGTDFADWNENGNGAFFAALNGD